jgi:prepilin-type N-terminal cleavage/methylation domain-containing protein
MRRGFTLVECMLAGALLALLSLALLEGVGVATRVAEANARLLAADSLAWDAAWKTFNVPYASLPETFNATALTAAHDGFDENVDIDGGAVQAFKLPKNAAPELYNAECPAVLLVAICSTPTTNDVAFLDTIGLDAHNDDFPRHKRIFVDVAWGPVESRRRLSAYHTVFVDRSARSRIPWGGTLQ